MKATFWQGGQNDNTWYVRLAAETVPERTILAALDGGDPEWRLPVAYLKINNDWLRKHPGLVSK